MEGSPSTGVEDAGEQLRARYGFRVRFRLSADRAGLSVNPASFETTFYRDADPPGDPGWRFFRDNCWRGELADSDGFRRRTEAALGVEVTAVCFRELRTTESYLDALRTAIADDLAAFNADSARAALSKYLGSSIHVVE